jgi:hypothetical protein
MCIVTFDQGHDTSLGPEQQFCEILNQFIHSVNSYGLDNVKNHYVYSDLDVWAVTLDQGRDKIGSSVTILWTIISIYAFSENLCPGQCIYNYEHSDLLDLWPITLN